VALDLLGREDAKALLLREAKRNADGAGADEIAALLGGLPLALRVAGALIKQNPGTSLERIAAALRERGAVRVLDAAGQPLDDYRNGIRISVSALLAESWNELPAERAELKDILKVLACFPESQLIRSELLRWLIDCPGGPLGFEDTFGNALAQLYNRNLLERPDDAHLRLHSLVREYAVEQAGDGFAEALLIRAAQRLRSPEFLVAQNGEALLTLLRELPMIEGTP
jgi:hypothetical protein